MTILAAQFSLVLGAWRLRLRVDVDEPHDAEAEETRERRAAARRGGVPAVPSSN